LRPRKQISRSPKGLTYCGERWISSMVIRIIEIVLGT
jgi:hypothetical protein